MSVALFALLLMTAPAEDPAALWARLLDPSIPVAERAQLAEQANAVLTPEYIAKVAALKLAIEQGHGRGDMRVVLEHVEVATRDADPYALVRDLPCTTQFEGRVIAETLRRFPMNAETYGVIYNFINPRAEDFFGRDLPEWWTFAGRDDWDAAQAFIVEASALVDADAPRIVTEIIPTLTPLMFDLERMLGRMHPRGSKEPFPATAFLALADRIENEPIHDYNQCILAFDAARILAIVDDPPFNEESIRTPEQCHLRLEQFRDWLDEHRGALETEAGKEAASVEDARKRMRRVTLCGAR